MNYLLSQKLLVGVLVTATVISQAINAEKLNVTTRANKCKDRDAVKEVNITFSPSNTTDCNYSFGCGKHEAEYQPCPASQQKPQSVISAESRNDTCVSSNDGSRRLARSAKDGRCYRICDFCNDKQLHGNDTATDTKDAKGHIASISNNGQSQLRQTCIDEKHTAEYIIGHSKKNVSNEGCKWKYKCARKENSTTYMGKAVGMRLRPSNGSRIRVQLYCCKMNCSYNCTKDKFNSMENQTIMRKLNESEVLTEIQVHKYEKKKGLQMYTVVLNKCSECPPDLPPPKDPPAIPVPVLAIGYGDDPLPIFNKCSEDEECNEGQLCYFYCQEPCNSKSDCTKPVKDRCVPRPGRPGPGVCGCYSARFACNTGEECCSGKCSGGTCAFNDGPCKYDLDCMHAFAKDGSSINRGVCIDGHCAAG